MFTLMQQSRFSSYAPAQVGKLPCVLFLCFYKVGALSNSVSLSFFLSSHCNLHKAKRNLVKPRALWMHCGIFFTALSHPESFSHSLSASQNFSLSRPCWYSSAMEINFLFFFYCIIWNIFFDGICWPGGEFIIIKESKLGSLVCDSSQSPGYLAGFTTASKQPSTNCLLLVAGRPRQQIRKGVFSIWSPGTGNKPFTLAVVKT